MTYRTRISLLILLDSIIVTFAIFVASWVVYPNIIEFSMPALIISSIALLISHHIFAMIYKLYNKVWAYASIGELIAIVKAITLSIISAGIVQYLTKDFTFIYKNGGGIGFAE